MVITTLPNLRSIQDFGFSGINLEGFMDKSIYFRDRPYCQTLRVSAKTSPQHQEALVIIDLAVSQLLICNKRSLLLGRRVTSNNWFMFLS